MSKPISSAGNSEMTACAPRSPIVTVNRNSVPSIGSGEEENHPWGSRCAALVMLMVVEVVEVGRKSGSKLAYIRIIIVG
jgi:hypothetical protein